MEIYDISKLKRKPEIIKNKLKIINGKVHTTDDLTIMFQSKYLANVLQLADISNTGISTVGIFAIIDNDGNYGVVNSIGEYNLPISELDTVLIDNEEYQVCKYSSDSIIFSSIDTYVKSDFIYPVFLHIFSNGNVPWFLNYEDVSDIFKTSGRYGDLGIGNDPMNFELITSMIARCRGNKDRYHKESINSEIAYVGLNDTIYGHTTTESRLIGNYLKDGLLATITKPEEKGTVMMEILK
jgi:hypothetical protein